MKKILAGLTAGIFWVGLTGLAQAQSVSGGDLFTEGPAYNNNNKTMITANVKKCVDHETFFTEGERNSECIKGPKTISTDSMLALDFNCEGQSYQHCELMNSIKSLRMQAINTMPAAGTP